LSREFDAAPGCQSCQLGITHDDLLSFDIDGAMASVRPWQRRDTAARDGAVRPHAGAWRS